MFLLNICVKCPSFSVHVLLFPHVLRDVCSLRFLCLVFLDCFFFFCEHVLVVLCFYLAICVVFVCRTVF